MIFLRQVRRNPLRLEGERGSSVDLAHGRLLLMNAAVLIVCLVLFVRAFDVSIIRAHNYDGGGRSGGEVAENAVRADIVDRNGTLLATTLKVSSLYADPHYISDPAKAAQQLAAIFPGNAYGDLLQKLQSKKRYVWIERKITPAQQAAVLQIGEPGLKFEHEYQRFYPQGELAAHLVGYGNVDGKGLAGIERAFDNYLRQDMQLKLSLDMRIQHILRREIRSAVEEFKGAGAAGVVMDVRNGEVLAGVSYPDFNPHLVGAAGASEKFNRLTLGAYELGSVFKIFSTAAFFEHNDVPINVTFDAREPLKVGPHTIRDYHAQNTIMTAPEVFMHSSNIGSALMGQAVGDEKLKAFYEDLGLLSPMEFEVREVARPLVPKPWREINTLTASYGHGVTTTPLQVASAVSSVVNGGYLVRPRLVIDDARHDQDPMLRVVSAKTVDHIRQMMRLVVSEGTGEKADVRGLRVGGKTGTAEKIVDGRYDTDKKISSFVGVFPMDAPRYAVFIMVDEPKGHKGTFGYATGGWVAAPAVGKVIEATAAVLGIAPARQNAPENFYGNSLKQYVSMEGAR